MARLHNYADSYVNQMRINLRQILSHLTLRESYSLEFDVVLPTTLDWSSKDVHIYCLIVSQNLVFSTKERQGSS